MPDEIPPHAVLLKLNICSCKIKLIANRCRYSKCNLQNIDILIVKITAPSEILAVMSVKNNFIFKIIKRFFMFTVSLFITSLSWAHLRVWNLYALINLACCWIYCNLKLHSSPNKTFYTFKVIWKYFLTYLLIKNIKGIPRYASFQLFFFSVKLE